MVSLDPPMQEFELLQQSLSQIYVVNYVTVAVFTALVYDTLLTLPREVKFVWSKPFTLSKGLYLFTRYFGLVDLGYLSIVSLGTNWSISLSCLLYVGHVGSNVLEACVNLILFLRIYALYGRSKKVLCLILPLYLTEILCVFYAGIKIGKAEAQNLMAVPLGISLPGCYLYVKETISFDVTIVAWPPSLVLTAIFFGLSLYKVRREVRGIAGNGPFWKLHTGSGFPALMKAIFRDGVIYYFANTFVVVLDAVLSLRQHSPYAAVASLLIDFVDSLCGSHFILNLHETAGKNQLITRITDIDIVFGSLAHAGTGSRSSSPTSS